MKLKLFLEGKPLLNPEVLGWFSHSFIKLFINNNDTQESILLHCLQALNLPKFSLNYFNNLLIQSHNKQWSFFFPEDMSHLPHWGVFTTKIRKQISCAQSGGVVKYMICPSLVFSLGLLQGKPIQPLMKWPCVILPWIFKRQRFCQQAWR